MGFSNNSKMENVVVITGLKLSSHAWFSLSYEAEGERHAG